jgi:ABC-2 type transport system permease protein
MRTFLILWRRELAAYFLSPVAWAVSVFFLLVMGLSFWMLALVLAREGGSLTVMSHWFGSIFFWLALIAVAPLLTMRLFAEERRSGTWELLMTAPVREAEVVAAKYAGALSFYVALWLPTLVYAHILRNFSPMTAQPDFGAIAGGYLGAFCVGALFLAIGLLASALTRNQIVAAIAGFGLICAIFFAGFIPWIWRSDALQRAAPAFSPVVHMLDFSRGTIDTRALAFYLINTAWLLFATVRILESRRGS